MSDVIMKERINNHKD